jgi:hypothetical protein
MDKPDIVRLIEKDRSSIIMNNVSDFIYNKINQNKKLTVKYSESEYIDGKIKNLRKLYSGSFYIYFEFFPNDRNKLTIYFDESDFSIVEIFIKQITKNNERD